MPLSAPLKETCEKYLEKFEKLKNSHFKDEDSYEKLNCVILLNNFQRELGQDPLSQEIKNIADSIHNNSLEENFTIIFTCINKALHPEQAKEAEILKKQAQVTQVAVNALPQQPKTEPKTPEGPLKRLCEAYQTTRRNQAQVGCKRATFPRSAT